MSESQGAKERIEGLAAYLKALEEGTDQGLEDLAGKEDPESIHQRLRMLLESNDISRAANLARRREPNARWVELGIIALCKEGEEAEARSLLAWSGNQKDPSLNQRCRLRYGQALFEHALSARPIEERIQPGSLTASEKANLARVLEALEPIVSYAAARGQISNPLEEDAVNVHAHCCVLLGRRAECESSVQLLATRKKLPLDVARFALQGIVSATPDLPERLRSEHPGSFEARMLACLVQGRTLNAVAEAYREARVLVDIAGEQPEKESLFRLLVDLSQGLGPHEQEETTATGEQLLGADHKLVKLWRSEQKLVGGDVEGAAEILRDIADEADPYWQQMQSHVCRQLNKPSEAILHLKRACELQPEPELYRQLSYLAHENGDLTVAEDALRSILNLDSEDEAARNNLAALLAETDRFDEAADHFGALHKRFPENTQYALNNASALMSAGNAEKAADIYVGLTKRENPPVEAVINSAQLMRTIDKAEKGLALLEQHKEKFWEDPRFVGSFMGLAYAAEQDEDAHDAFVQLRILQESGKAPSDILKSGTLEELIGFVKERQQEDRKRQEELLRGRTSWLLVDHAKQHPSLMAWMIRTQPCRWVVEDPINTARHTIYATNRYSAISTELSCEFEEIECAPRGTPIVVDVSALITLHKLGMLEKAADYFGAIHYPVDYMTLFMDEVGRLVAHQPSQRSTLDTIKLALDEGRLFRLGDEVDEEMPSIDEYDEEEQSHRIADVAEWLEEAGLITATAREHLLRVTTAGSSTLPRIDLGARIRVGLVTLETLTQFQVLDALCSAFRVYLDNEDYLRVVGGISSFKAQEEARIATRELWVFIRGNSRFVPGRSFSDRSESIARRVRQSVLSSVQLAIEQSAPLLADDRVLQSAILASRPSERSAGFGTDCVIAALAESGAITLDVAADAMLTLMRWRYRFLVAPSELLYRLLLRNKNHPPGRDLRSVASYVHDSMRDPGLFAGVEKTDSPTTVATRLFQAWVMALAELIADAWLEGDLAESQATTLTEWVVRECLPSPPRNLGRRGRVVADMTRKIVFSHVLLRVCGEDVALSNRALQAVAAAVDYDATEYLRATADTINELPEHFE